MHGTPSLEPDNKPRATLQGRRQGSSAQAHAARARQRTLWHSILTTGAVMLGVHMVTVPLAWPRQDTAFQGLCRSTSQGPSRVRCCATMRPVLVSCTTNAALLKIKIDYACTGEAALCSSAQWEQHGHSALLDIH